MTTFNIHNQKFGIEIEFGGINRSTAAQIIADHFNTSYNRSGSMDAHNIIDNKGRKWKIVYDASVDSMGAGGNGSELVSPPLKYEDMDDLQNIIRKLRRAGAKVNESCGTHVHVDLGNYSAKSLKNLVKYFAKYEDMFYKAASVHQSRLNQWTKPLKEKHPELVENIGKVKTLDDLKKLWYGYDKQNINHYDSSRYAGLNLHNIWYKGWMSGTVEFRMFNGSLHAGEIRTYITLALAISAKALNAKSVNGRTNSVVDDVHLFPKILGGLGIVKNDETMKNVYMHLTKNMRATA